ncbi:hypothetical protein [Alloactinosynnema sp. L-07]|uniref:caspase family protein n=1 Tax=Alloactinosynnema sp. L-07 TaxID=1653480 RepID=UPI00065F0693|nr:caspase family protein [Alloactinosynnema sp. L-07]CRK57039.1 hypothetical protein [Alloactinosynnema sp. L-07]
MHACRDAAREDGVRVDPELFDTIKWQDRWFKVGQLCAEHQGPAHQPLLDRMPVATPPGMMWLPDRKRSAYVMLGNASSPAAHPLPGVIDNIEQLTASLKSAAPWMQVTTVLDATMQEATSALRSAARQTQDVLIVHVLGHGYLDDQMALRLLTSDSRPDDLATTTLNLTTVIDDVEASSNAAALVLIVDTCFAGQTIPKSSGRLKKHLFVLAATDAHSVAWDGPNSLTGVMASVLGEGVPDCPFPMLSVDLLAQECARVHEQRQIPSQVITTFSHGDAHKITFGLNADGAS